MKSTWDKNSALTAIVFSFISFVLVITALVVSMFEEPTDMGVSTSFAFWIYSVIVSYIALVFYFIDAIGSIKKVLRKIHPVFNTVLSAMLIGAVPMLMFVGGGLGINILIWNIYHLAIFVLEIVSIVKHLLLNAAVTDSIEPKR